MGKSKDETRYVYRYIDKNKDIVYVGKTNSIHNRVYQHKQNELWTEDKSLIIEYITLQSRLEEDIYESYYINLWNPKFNIAKKNLGMLSFPLPEKEWVRYNPNDFLNPSTTRASRAGITYKSEKQKKMERQRAIICKFYEEIKKCMTLAYENINSIYEIFIEEEDVARAFSEVLLIYSTLKIEDEKHIGHYSLIKECRMHKDGKLTVSFRPEIAEEKLSHLILEQIKELEKIVNESKVTTHP